MRLPRSALTRLADAFSRSSPSSASFVARRFAARGSRPITASAVIDLPQPDSPTRHSVSPRFTWNDTSRTARSGPRGVAMSTPRPSTSRTTSPDSASALRSCASFGRQHVAQAVAGRLIAKTSDRQRARRAARSARTRRTCTPWPRRSSAPRTAAAAARRGRGRTARLRAGSRSPPPAWRRRSGAASRWAALRRAARARVDAPAACAAAT